MVVLSALKMKVLQRYFVKVPRAMAEKKNVAPIEVKPAK